MKEERTTAIQWTNPTCPPTMEFYLQRTVDGRDLLVMKRLVGGQLTGGVVHCRLGLDQCA